jgi:hypothetical protein
MIDTHKLLYILPDVAYTAELLPDKKPQHFTVHAFTQINGTFFDENENLIAEKVDKLLSKLEKGEEYHLILPDFLFTNTIISVKETSETKIKEYLKTETLPSLGVSQDTHELITVILNQLRGTTRVQLAGLEKDALISLRVAAAEHEVTISGISPLSWVIKSSVSLEPSITVAQMGGHLYAAEHYIGVDQTSYAAAEDCESIAETIKTLKGAEPSIQTVYIFSNALVEEKLKELLNKTLPLQQMASGQEDDERMPSYVRQVIESSMRSLSIPEYPVPVFSLGKASAADKKALGDLPIVVTKNQDDEEDSTDLPKPQAAQAAVVIPPSDLPEEPEDDVEELEETELAETEPDEPITAVIESPVDEKITIIEPELTEKKEISKEKEEIAVETAVTVGEEHIDLRQFVQAQSDSTTPVVVKTEKPRIQHSSGVWPMMRMILIAIGVFLITVGVGIGIGFAFLKFSAPKSNSEVPVVEVVPTAEPEATPTGSPSATPTASASGTVKAKQLKLLVVNATKKSGYANTIKSKIDTAKVGTTTTGNAKGTYTQGILIYQKTADAAVLDKIQKATALTLTEDTKIATAEDPQGTYDIVIVLAE